MTATVDPFAVEVRYTLDMMGYLLQRTRGARVRIATESPELAIAVVRRLAYDDYRLSVDTNAIRGDVANMLGIDVDVAGREPADVAFCPFSVDARRPPAEASIVGATRNALSYRSLRYPGSVGQIAPWIVGRVARHYSLDEVVGLFSPGFVARLGAARLAGLHDAARSVQLADEAMRRIYARGRIWGLCYVVAFVGHR